MNDLFGGRLPVEDGTPMAEVPVEDEEGPEPWGDDDAGVDDDDPDLDEEL